MLKDSFFGWVSVRLAGWYVRRCFSSRAAKAGGFSLAFLLYSLAIPFIAAESGGSPLEVIAVVACMVSIFLTLVVYKLTHRNECRACGHRAAMKKTGAKRHVKEDFLFLAHDDALWRCKYCHREVWKSVWDSYRGGGGWGDWG